MGVRQFRSSLMYRNVLEAVPCNQDSIFMMSNPSFLMSGEISTNPTLELEARSPSSRKRIMNQTTFKENIFLKSERTCNHRTIWSDAEAGESSFNHFS